MTRMYEVWDPESRNILGWFRTEAEAQDLADLYADEDLVIAVSDDDGMYERIPRRAALAGEGEPS